MKLRLRTFLLLAVLSFAMSNKGWGQITAGFTFTPLNGCAPQVVQFTSTSTGTITSYSWNFGNGAPVSPFQNPSTSYTSPGTYTVTLTVTGPSGTKTATGTIIIYPAPTVSFTFSPGSGCAPLAVAFSPSVNPGVTGMVTYFWDFGDGFTIGTASPNHTYASAGTFTPKLTVTNSKGCSTTYVSTNTITVHPKPTGSFTAFPTTNCSLPAIVGFSNSTSGSNPVAVTWNFGNGPGAGNNPTNVYTNASTYNVVMYMTDANGCKDSVVRPNYIYAQPNNANFTGPATACDSSSVSFTNITPNNTGAIWSFGDGTGNFNGTTQSHTYTSPGTYQVRMITMVPPCADTVIKSILVNPRPVAWITYDTPCPPPSVVNFHATSSITVATFQWTWASGGTATGANPTHPYTYGRVDSVRLIATSAVGCSDTLNYDSVFVYNAFAVGGGLPFQGCAPLSTKFSAVVQTTIPCTAFGRIVCPTNYPFPVINWHWEFDGNPLDTANGPIVNHTFDSVGQHYATVAMTTSNGCVIRDTFYVAAGKKIPPSFTGGPFTVCVKVPVHLTNTTGDTGIVYHWDWGDGVTTGLHQGDYKYTRPGTYSVKLISDYNGCYDTVIRPNLITILPSDANFTDSIGCPPNKTVQFRDISIGASTHLWNFGDGSPQTTVQNPVHTYPAPGNYLATHMTWNSTYGCRDTVTDTIRVFNPILSFSALDTTLCQRDTIHLRAYYSGPVLDSLRWRFNDDYCYTDSAVKYVKDTMLYPTGFYKIAVYIRYWDSKGMNICKDSVVKNNYAIVSHPVAAFSAPSIIGCTPFTATFIDSSVYTTGTAPINRHWRFGDGDTASNNSISTSHTYIKTGVFTVKLKVTDWNGCPDSLTRTAYIESRKPNAFYQVKSLNACIGDTLAFTNSSAGSTALTCNWYFGDGDTAKGFFNISHAYRTTGTFLAKLVVFDSTGCTDTMIKPITVTKPVAAFGLSDSLSICPPLIVQFTSTSTNASSYKWDFKNTGSATIANPASTFTAPGIYNVMLVVKDANGCPDTAYSKVRVLGYAGALNYGPLKGCVPLSVNFNATISGVSNMVWDFADGTTMPATGLTASHTYTFPGAFVPKLIFSSSPSCNSSSIGLDTIKVDGIKAGFKVLPPCEKTPLQFIDTSFSYFSAIKDWRWDFGTLGVATGNPINRSFGAAGTYPVSLYVTNAQGCKDSVKRNVVIFPLPKVVAMDDTSLCVPDALPLSVKGALTYTWTPGASLSCTSCPQPIATPTVPTSYIVTGTDSNGCVNKDTVKIGIQTKTTFVALGSGEICLGQSVRLLAAGATAYDWTPAESLDSPSGKNPLASPKVNTTYIVTGREGSCLADTHQVKVIVRPLPSVDAGSDTRIIAGSTVQLHANGMGISRLEWTTDSSLSCLNCYAPDASPKKSTTYYLTAYNEYGCRSSDSVRVEVMCDGNQLFIPNTFSPNADGNNDVFFPRGNGIDRINSFRVYSRWGELLFERSNVSVNDERAGWNGTHAGRILNPDVYVYIIEASCETGAPIKFKGDVTLLR